MSAAERSRTTVGERAGVSVLVHAGHVDDKSLVSTTTPQATEAWYTGTVPPWSSLDFPVLVPANSLGQTYRMHSCGWGRYGTQPAAVFSEIAVGVDGDPDGAPDWVVATRPRRGIRPLDPASTTGVDHLLMDPDLREIASDAVSGLLLATMRQDLSGKELSELAEREGAQARALASALHLERQPGDPWRREVLHVDEEVFALWVLDHARGWAAVGDLGATRVVMYGTSRPTGWQLSKLGAGEVVVALLEPPGSRDVSPGDPDEHGWFGQRRR